MWWYIDGHMVFGDAIGSYSPLIHISLAAIKNMSKVVDIIRGIPQWYTIDSRERKIFNYADLFSIEFTGFSSDFDCCCICGGVDCL